MSPSKRQRRADGAAGRRKAAAVVYCNNRGRWLTAREFCGRRAAVECGAAVGLSGTGQCGEDDYEILEEIRVACWIHRDGSATRTREVDGEIVEQRVFPPRAWKWGNWPTWPSNFGSRWGVSVEGVDE